MCFSSLFGSPPALFGLSGKHKASQRKNQLEVKLPATCCWLFGFMSAPQNQSFNSNKAFREGLLCRCCTARCYRYGYEQFVFYFQIILAERSRETSEEINV